MANLEGVSIRYQHSSVLAVVNEDTDELRIVRVHASYWRELQHVCLMYAYPTLLFLGLLGWSSLSGFKDAWPAALFVTVYLSFLWIPVIQRVVGGLSHPFELVLNKHSHVIQMNGKKWCSFDEIKILRLVTQLGPLAYRRFRVVLDRIDGQSLIVIDTPLVASWAAASKYLFENIEDQQKFKVNSLESHYCWIDFIPGMRGYDQSDPFIVEVVGIYDCLTKILPSMAVTGAQGVKPPVTPT